jgi:hypothetical protein
MGKEDHELKASLCYIERLCLTKKKKKERKRERKEERREGERKGGRKEERNDRGTSCCQLSGTLYIHHFT